MLCYVIGARTQTSFPTTLRTDPLRHMPLSDRSTKDPHTPPCGNFFPRQLAAPVAARTRTQPAVSAQPTRDPPPALQRAWWRANAFLGLPEASPRKTDDMRGWGRKGRNSERKRRESTQPGASVIFPLAHPCYTSAMAPWRRQETRSSPSQPPLSLLLPPLPRLSRPPRRSHLPPSHHCTCTLSSAVSPRTSAPAPAGRCHRRPRPRP
jgi:hypothetical protein